MVALLILITCYWVVLLLGKCTEKTTLLGYILIAVVTIIQVLLVYAYLYNMEVPEA